MTNLFQLTSRNDAVRREPTIRKTIPQKDRVTTSKNSLKAVLMGVFDAWYNGKFGQTLPAANGIRERPQGTGATVTQQRTQQRLTPRVRVRGQPRTAIHGAEGRTHASHRHTVRGPATLQRNLLKQNAGGVTSQRQYIAPKSEPGGQRLKLFNDGAPTLVAPRPRIAPKPKPQVRSQRIQLFTGLSPKLLQSATKPKVREQTPRLFRGLMPPAPPQPAPARAKPVSFWSGLQTQTEKPLKPVQIRPKVQHVVAIRRPTTAPAKIPPIFTVAPPHPPIFTVAPQPPIILTDAQPVQPDVAPKQYMATAPSASEVSNAITTKITAMISATKAALALAAEKAGIVSATQSATTVTAEKPASTATATAQKPAYETAKTVTENKAAKAVAAATSAAKGTTAAPATTTPSNAPNTTAPAGEVKSNVISNVTANVMYEGTANNITGSSAHNNNITSNITATASSNVTAKHVIVISAIGGNVKSGVTYDVIANNDIAPSAPSSNITTKVTSNAKSEIMTKTATDDIVSKNTSAYNITPNVTIISVQTGNVTLNVTSSFNPGLSAYNVTNMSAPTDNSTANVNTKVNGNNVPLSAHTVNDISQGTSNITFDVTANNVTALTEHTGNITSNVTSKATSILNPNVTAINVTARSADMVNATSNVTLNATSKITANVTSNVAAVSALTGNATAANASSANVTAANVTAGYVTAANATTANVTTANATAANATANNATANNATANNATATTLPAEAFETTTVAYESIDPEVLAEINEGRVNQGLRPLLIHEVDVNGNTLPPPTVPPSILFLAGGHGHGLGHGHGPINHGHGNNRRHEHVNNAHDRLHSPRPGKSGGNMLGAIHNTHLAAHLQSGPMTAAQHRNLHRFLQRWGQHAVRPIPTTAPPMHYLQQLDPDLYQDYLELKQAKQAAAAGR